MVEPAIFGPIDTLLAPVIEYLLLLLVVANLATRLLAYRSHKAQAEDGPAAVTRHTLHEASNWLLVLVTFYFLTLRHHSGIVLSVLVVGMVLADFFEFEARKVEARRELPIEPPKGAITASVLVVAYAAYLALFFIVEPLWNAIV